MSVHGMKPHFTSWEGYQEWIKDWRELYAYASLDIRTSKARIKHYQKLSQRMSAGEELNEINAALPGMMREFRYKRVTARKLLTVREEAKIRWENIKSIRRGVAEQLKEFPLEVETKNIDFHFNKKSLEFDFIPMWVVKARGKTYYVKHMECLTGFTTRETPDHPSTKGSLRVRRGTLKIDAEGNATIS